MDTVRRALPRAQRRFWVLVDGVIGFTTDVTMNGFCVEGVSTAQPGAPVTSRKNSSWCLLLAKRRLPGSDDAWPRAFPGAE